jgi:hypothetical protein
MVRPCIWPVVKGASSQVRYTRMRLASSEGCKQSGEAECDLGVSALSSGALEDAAAMLQEPRWVLTLGLLFVWHVGCRPAASAGAGYHSSGMLGKPRQPRLAFVACITRTAAQGSVINTVLYGYSTELMFCCDLAVVSWQHPHLVASTFTAGSRKVLHGMRLSQIRIPACLCCSKPCSSRCGANGR